MEYNTQIREMANGDSIEGFYVLKDAIIKTTAAGKSFLSGSISDCSGAIDLKVWDYNGPIGSTAADIGKVVKLRGDVSEYKSALQFTASRIRLAESTDSYDVSSLVPVAPIDAEETLHWVRALVHSISDEDYRRIAETLLERHVLAFRSIPAAKSVHHSFVSGLLMHTANMLKTAEFLSGLYADVIDRSLLLTGTLLHDFAKESEFSFSALGLVTDYSEKGQLLGHLVLGAQEVAETGKELALPEEKILLLEHMILSHHGEPEFGAAVKPAIAEAELLYCIDTLDSRMEIYAENLREIPAGCFTGRIFALDKKIYHHEMEQTR